MLHLLNTIRAQRFLWLLLPIFLVFAFQAEPAFAQNCGVDQTAFPDGNGGFTCLDPPPDSTNEAGSDFALFLIDYSLGLNNPNGCLSCTFVQQFLVALASFSAAVFMYFRAFFVTLTPLVLSIWIGWSVGRLMIAGGDGGKDFFYAMVRKLALFFMLWAVMMQSGPQGDQARDPSAPMTITDGEAPWTWMGPDLMRYGFELGNEVRTTASQNLMVGSGSVAGQVAMNCGGVADSNTVLSADPEAYAFAYHASETACAIERIHIVGIASGWAMIVAAWTNLEFSWSPKEVFYALAQALTIAVFGFFVIAVFGLSMVWFIFLLLDVVVKVLVVAAISPILMVLALLVPTRTYAWNAVRQSVGGVATLLGVAFVAALSFYLIANTVTVYNAANGLYDPALTDIPRNNTVADLRSFVQRLTMGNEEPNRIPMNISTPWYHYMLLTSLSTYVLGKKVISIIESIIGARGMSEMADNAKKIAVMGAAMAGAGAYFGMKATPWALGTGIKTIGAGWGAGKTGLAWGKNAAMEWQTAPNWFDMGKGMLKGPESYNPMGNIASKIRDLKTGNIGETLRNTGGVSAGLRNTLDETTQDGPR
jgi:hypothetical protein